MTTPQPLLPPPEIDSARDHPEHHMVWLATEIKWIKDYAMRYAQEVISRPAVAQPGLAVSDALITWAHASKSVPLSDDKAAGYEQARVWVMAELLNSLGAQPAAVGAVPHDVYMQAMKSLKIAVQERDAKQARIDELMLEFCPDEMTSEQTSKWASHQIAVGAVPEFLPIAARKLAELQAKGYVVNGYSLIHPETRQRVLIDSSGFVGWWSNRDHEQGGTAHTSLADRLAAVLQIYREQEQQGIASEAELLAAVRRVLSSPQPKEPTA